VRPEVVGLAANFFLFRGRRRQGPEGIGFSWESSIWLAVFQPKEIKENN
jgi:hypothetical protein